MNTTYRKETKAVVLKLCAGAPRQTQGNCWIVLIWDTETPVGHHTNNNFQGVGHNYLINLTIRFSFCLGIDEKKKVKWESLGTSGLNSRLWNVVLKDYPEYSSPITCLFRRNKSISINEVWDTLSLTPLALVRTCLVFRGQELQSDR